MPNPLNKISILVGTLKHSAERESLIAILLYYPGSEPIPSSVLLAYHHLQDRLALDDARGARLALVFGCLCHSLLIAVTSWSAATEKTREGVGGVAVVAS